MVTKSNDDLRLERPLGLFLTIVVLAATAVMIVRDTTEDRGQDTLPEQLVFAAARGDLVEVRRVLAESERGGETVTPQQLGDALVRAAACGQAEVLEELLRRGADPDSPRRNGVTVLMQLTEREEDGAEIARRLIRAGATVDAADDKGRTALMDAVAAGHVELVRVLLEAGASVAVEDRAGRCPLSEATAGGDRALLDLLKGASRAAPAENL
jgi:ankyrin repeat protein